MPDLELHVGVKTDPAEYRFSYEWLFRLLADEGIRYVQLGSFFELYRLGDPYFLQLRRQAEDFGITIASLFTSHRELGGFFRLEAGWEQVARAEFERLIDVAALVGASSAGSNPGSVLRDRMGDKDQGVRCYLRHMRELMSYAADRGVERLTIEPMSCLAEPPTLPEEMQEMAADLDAYHREQPDARASVGLCVDVAHGYADRDRCVRWDNVQLLEAGLPHLTELHLKNTDDCFEQTFGFSADERREGIVDVAQIRDLLLARADVIPVNTLIGYLEIGGPKLGRDYSDGGLERELRDSLSYLRETFRSTPPADRATSPCAIDVSRPDEASEPERPVVRVSPSLMCADTCFLADEVRGIEALGVDMWHLDVMDADFVPNMPLGLGTIADLRPRTALPFDVHLMVRDNDWFVEQVARIGVQQIAVHAESALHLDRTLTLIRRHGIKAGVALNPATPLSSLEFVLEHLDFVLLMTVNPGFAGQALVPSALRKIADCRAFLQERARDVAIEVDGNVSFENIPEMVAAGADILVAGTSSLFHKGVTRVPLCSPPAFSPHQ